MLEANKRRWAVLGGAGLIGTAICRCAARAHDAVFVVDLNSPPSDLVDEAWTADLGDPAVIDALVDDLASKGVYAVLFLAAYYDFENRPDPRYERVEVGLRQLVVRMKVRLPTTPLVFASSMTSLASTEPGRRLTEESPRTGDWAYPAHKLRCEDILEKEGADLPTAELVLSGVYSDWCELVPLYRHIERVRSSPLLRNLYPGRADRGLTYVHVDDVAKAFFLTAEALKTRSGVHRFLIGEARPVTYETIQQTASTVFFGRHSTLVRVPRRLARAGVQVLSRAGVEPFIKPWMVSYSGEHFEFDLSKTTTELGWAPRHDLSRELEAMCRRARDERREWSQRNEARPY